VDLNTLAALPSPIISKLSPPITLIFSWGSVPAGAQRFVLLSFLGAAKQLEACCRASAGMLQVYIQPGARLSDEGLVGLEACASKGVHRLGVAWGAGDDLTPDHMQALGASVGPFITHLTLETMGSITDDVWSGLWAAFPRLQHLSLYMPNPGSAASVLCFCAAAPHALELHLAAGCYRALASHLEEGLDSTRVMVTEWA
jgi:hypothetical protein